jgi:hypothetical protein
LEQELRKIPEDEENSHLLSYHEDVLLRHKKEGDGIVVQSREHSQEMETEGVETIPEHQDSP